MSDDEFLYADYRSGLNVVNLRDPTKNRRVLSRGHLAHYNPWRWAHNQEDVSSVLVFNWRAWNRCEEETRPLWTPCAEVSVPPPAQPPTVVVQNGANLHYAQSALVNKKFFIGAQSEA